MQSLVRVIGEVGAADGLTAEDLKDAGIDQPLLVGGAALSDRFTSRKDCAGYMAGRLCTRMTR
jgi:cobalamin-dependent methionine synthase I